MDQSSLLSLLGAELKKMEICAMWNHRIFHFGLDQASQASSRTFSSTTRKGNPISVRLDLNRSSDPSRFSEGDRESHRMGSVRLFLIFVCPTKKGVRGRCRCPGRTRLLLTLEDHRKKPGTRACRERRTRGGCASTVSPGHS